MPDAVCPVCGSNEVQCESSANLAQRLLAGYWRKSAVACVFVAATCAVFINLFLFDEGSIDKDMAASQAVLAGIISLAAWGLYRYGKAGEKRPTTCRCMLCGREWIIRGSAKDHI